MATAQITAIQRRRGQKQAAMLASATWREGKQCAGTSKSHSASNAALRTGGRAMGVGQTTKIAQERSVATAMAANARVRTRESVCSQSARKRNANWER